MFSRVEIAVIMFKHIREPLSNYQLLPCGCQHLNMELCGLLIVQKPPIPSHGPVPLMFLFSTGGTYSTEGSVRSSSEPARRSNQGKPSHLFFYI